MKGLRLIRSLSKRRVDRASDDLLREIAAFQESAYRARVEDGLAKLRRVTGPEVCLGAAPWGKEASIPLSHLIAHSLIVGSSGAGKSFTALSIVLEMLRGGTAQFGLLDAKGELFGLALRYLYAILYRLSDEEREKMKQKIVIIDFSDTARISPYNILAPLEGQDVEFLVENRIEAIGELFSDQVSPITPRMRTIMKYLFQLAALGKLPLPWIGRLMDDQAILQHIVRACPHEQVRNYFLSRFDKEPKATVSAVRQRIDAILASESVRLALEGESAPDFRKLQDEGSIVLINTAGRNISRSVSLLLQILILQDIKQSIFGRKNSQQPYLWFFDEAQNFYRLRSAHRAMNEILTMARSFGSFACLITQSISSAIRDADTLNTLLTNIRWMLMFRSTRTDARLIEPAIPITGNMQKRSRHPYEKPMLMTPAEEKSHRLGEIAHLHDRAAYLWFKSELSEAILMRTTEVPPPHAIAGCSEEELARFMETEELGGRVKKDELIARIKEREKEFAPAKKAERKAPQSKAFDDSLEQEYRLKTSRRKKQ